MEISAPAWLCFYLDKSVHLFLLHIFIVIWLFMQVLFHVNNGAGRITATYEPGVANSLCDGKWHKLQANTSKYRISLIIDGNLVQTDNPYIQSTSADTNNPIYVGGYPGGYNNISFSFSPSFVLSFLRINPLSSSMSYVHDWVIDLSYHFPSCYWDDSVLMVTFYHGVGIHSAVEWVGEMNEWFHFPAQTCSLVSEKDYFCASMWFVFCSIPEGSQHPYLYMFRCSSLFLLHS